MRSPLYVTEQGAKLARAGRRIEVTKESVTLTSAAVLQLSQITRRARSSTARSMNLRHGP